MPAFMTPIYKVSSTVLPRQDRGSVLPSAAAGEELGQVPHQLQVLRSEERKASFSQPHYPMADEKGVTCPSIPCPQSQLTYSSANTISSIELPGEGVGPSLLSASAGEEGQG